MIKQNWVGLCAMSLMVISILLMGAIAVNPTAFESISGSSAPPYAAVIDKTKVLDIQIVANDLDWANMLSNATAEEYIEATIIINGTKINHVGIRPKGNSSLSMVARDSSTDRYSFKIEFDHYISRQSWFGLDKLVLNNMQGDATYMKEYLSYDLMDYIGVAAPLYAFSNITVNGTAWGFYLAVEALEDSYAKRIYGNDHGKLYKPESMGMRGNGQMNAFLEGMQENAADGELQRDGIPENADEGRPRRNGMPGNAAEGRLPREGTTDKTNSLLENGESGWFGERSNSRELSGESNGQGGFGGRSRFGGFGGREGFVGQSGATSLQYINDDISSYASIFDTAVFDSTDNDYMRVIQAIKKLSDGEDIENVVEISATLKYFAAHTVIVNLDSYVSNMCHNYYLYEKNGQLTMLPWDFNLAFGGFQSGNASSIVNFPIDTPVSGVNLEERPLLAKLLEIPECMALYHAYLAQIVTGYFNSGLFEQTVDSLHSLISPYISADPSAFYTFEAYELGVIELKKLGLLRAQSVNGQLDGNIPSTADGQSANSDALIDASAINLSSLGSMGGGGFGGGFSGGFGGNGGRFNRDGEGELGDGGGGFDRGGNRLNRGESGFGGEGGGFGGERGSRFEGDIREASEFSRGMGENPAGMEGNGLRTPPQNVDGFINPRRESMDIFWNSSSAITPGLNITAWIVLGSYVGFLCGGLIFVISFKRRRSI